MNVPRGAVTPHETFIPFDGTDPSTLLPRRESAPIIAELDKGSQPVVPDENNGKHNASEGV